MPRLFFVGGEVTTYNNPLTHGLQSEWVAAVITVRARRESKPALRLRIAPSLRRAPRSRGITPAAQGALALPAVEAQERDVARLREWRRSFIPANDSRAAKYQLHGNQYHDQLVRDLGHRTLRKARPPRCRRRALACSEGGD